MPIIHPRNLGWNEYYLVIFIHCCLRKNNDLILNKTPCALCHYLSLKNTLQIDCNVKVKTVNAWSWFKKLFSLSLYE